MTDLFDDDDLFAVRPVVQAKPARRPAKPHHVPDVSEMVRQPSGIVASFSCVCSAQDEVREPAPRTVLCWNCKPQRRMKRWNPGYDTPHVSARELTAAEREGMPSRPG